MKLLNQNISNFIEEHEIDTRTGDGITYRLTNGNDNVFIGRLAGEKIIPEATNIINNPYKEAYHFPVDLDISDLTFIRNDITVFNNQIQVTIKLTKESFDDYRIDSYGNGSICLRWNLYSSNFC